MGYTEPRGRCLAGLVKAQIYSLVGYQWIVENAERRMFGSMSECGLGPVGLVTVRVGWGEPRTRM